MSNATAMGVTILHHLNLRIFHFVAERTSSPDFRFAFVPFPACSARSAPNTLGAELNLASLRFRLPTPKPNLGHQFTAIELSRAIHHFHY